MPNIHQPQSSNQLALNFHQKPGRPIVQPDRRRKARTVTLAPDVIAQFDAWTYRNRQSFSRGVEAAMMAFIERSDNDADV